MADPYTSKSASDASTSEKIKEFRGVIKDSKFAMLTTQSADGTLHSRAMSPASSEGLIFLFLANKNSGKFDELTANPKVNVSWSDPSSTNWASLAGKAEVVENTEAIKSVWSPAIKAWFGDLKDGKHTGDYNDPRVAIIKVTPFEVRYWIKTESSLAQAYEVAKGALTGETASPGELRVLNSNDLALAQQVEKK